MDADDFENVELGEDSVEDLGFAFAVFDVAVLLGLLLTGIIGGMGTLLV